MEKKKKAGGPLRMKLCAGCAERIGLTYWVNEVSSSDRLEPCQQCNMFYRLATYELTPKNRYVPRARRRGAGKGREMRGKILPPSGTRRQ